GADAGDSVRPRLEQGAEERGRAVQDGRLARLERPEERRGREGGVDEDPLRAGGDRVVEQGETEGMRNRNDKPTAGGTLQAEGRREKARALDLSNVLDQNAFRDPGRPGRVEDRRDLPRQWVWFGQTRGQTPGPVLCNKESTDAGRQDPRQEVGERVAAVR